MRSKYSTIPRLLSLIFISFVFIFSTHSAKAQTAVLENFENSAANWVITRDTANGGIIAQTTEQASSSVFSARLSVSGSNQSAKISYSFDDGSNHSWGERPGTYNWQRAKVYLPSSVVNSIGANGYITIGQMWSTSTNTGWSLKVKQNGKLYVEGRRDYDNALIEFNVYGNIPVDQWFTLELGLHSQNGPGVKQAFAFLINGDFYGYYHQAKWLDSYNKASIGLISSNVAGNLNMYVDDWGTPATTSTPTGADNRPTANVFEKDYRDVSGKNWQIDWTTWDSSLILSGTAGIYSASSRFQSGFNQERMPDLTNGWGEIEIGWNGVPALNPSDYFSAMIGMRKEINKEQNLEVIPKGNGNNTVDLLFEAWTDSGPVVFASWPIPAASYNPTYHIPENGDIIRARWEQVTASNINVKASYYDASTNTWYNDVINHTFNGDNVSGINYNDGYHKASSITSDSTTYSIKRYKVGTLDTFPGGTVNQYPQTNITSPFTGQSFNEGTITINANATDPDGTISKVEFFNGASKLGESLSAPFSYIFAATAGTYNLTSRATDNLGATANSSVVTITVYSTAPQNQAPESVIDTPVSNVTITAGSAVNFTGTVTDPDNNTPFTYLWTFGGGATNSTQEDPGNITFNTPGVYTVSFKGTDSLGLADSTPATITVTVNAPSNVLPSTSITSPANGSSFPVGNITINASATDPDGNISKVEFFNGASKLGEDLSNPYSYILAAGTGVYNLTSRATDNMGATANSGIVTITVVGSTQSGGTITLTATQVVNQDNNTYTTSGNWIGTGGSTTKSYLGTRFEGMNIPANATITSAQLEYTSNANQWLTKNVNVYYETGTAPVFSSSNKPSARPLSALVTTSNDNVNSPAGSKITINLPPANLNINSLDHLNMILKGTGPAYARKFVYGTGAGNNTPVLRITYTTP